MTLEEANTELKCSRSTLLKYKKLYNIELPISFKVCNYCNNMYELIIKDRQDKERKYCSEKCRDRAFRANNPDKARIYNHKSLLKKKIYCKSCSKIIPDHLRTNRWAKYCSTDCIKNARLIGSRKSRMNAQVLFEQYKVSIGCKLCHYNKFGGSLAFHHIDPNVKDTRITAKDFTSKNNKWATEAPKCIILCNNCHHEIHKIMRIDLNYYYDLLNNPRPINFD